MTPRQQAEQDWKNFFPTTQHTCSCNNCGAPAQPATCTYCKSINEGLIRSAFAVMSRPSPIPSAGAFPIHQPDPYSGARAAANIVLWAAAL